MATYNGWTNYPTWRVYLEYFDGAEMSPVSADDVRLCVEDYVDDEVRSDTLRGWVDYFLGEVDWEQIADHLNGGDGEEDEEA
jgi:hypothetical protein